jgi:hypothetical protein
MEEEGSLSFLLFPVSVGWGVKTFLPLVQVYKPLATRKSLASDTPQ